MNGNIYIYIYIYIYTQDGGYRHSNKMPHAVSWQQNDSDTYIVSHFTSTASKL